MTIFKASMLSAMAAGLIAAASMATPASALTMQECSAKYSAAKTAGSLGGKSWNDFRKAECGTDAAATPAAAPAAPAAAEAKPAAPAKQAAAPKAAPMAAPAAAPAAMPAGDAKFPAAVDPKYAKETAGKARMHSCLDQYNANKTTNGNGGLKWIEKGGGYYSECTKRLKG